MFETDSGRQKFPVASEEPPRACRLVLESAYDTLFTMLMCPNMLNGRVGRDSFPPVCMSDRLESVTAVQRSSAAPLC